MRVHGFNLAFILVIGTSVALFSAGCGDDTTAPPPGGTTEGETTGETTTGDADATTTGDNDATTTTTGDDDAGTTTGIDDTGTTTGIDDTGTTTGGDDDTGTTTGGDDAGATTEGDDAGGTTTGETTGETTGDEESGIPGAELLIKIIGPPKPANSTIKPGGLSHDAVQGGVTPITGIIFGEPDSITWTTNSGQSGEAEGSPFWQTPGIPLEPGFNIITVTAHKGEETRSDTINIVYNPGFLFDDPPTVSPNLMFAGEPTNAVITIPITLYKSFDPNTVQAWLVDAEGKPTSNQALGKLADQGTLSACDEIQQDGIFSACLKNISCSGDDLLVSVSAEIDTGMAQYTAWSAPVRIECGQRIQAASCSAAQQALKDARAQYESEGANTAARDATIGWLKSQSNVADAGPASGDGFGIWVEFSDGFLGALNLSPEGTRGGGAALTASALFELARSQGNPFNQKTITSKKALVVAASMSEFTGWEGGDEASDIANKLNDSGCPTFTVDGPLANANADLTALRHQYLFGIVAMTAHGDAFFEKMNEGSKEKLGWDHKGSQEVIWSGEAANCSALTTTNKTCKVVLQQGQIPDSPDCPAGTECVITGASGSTLQGHCVDKTQMDLRKGRAILSDTNWGITGEFIAAHAQRRFPNSLVYLGSCRSMYNGTLAAEYAAAGALAIAGFGGYVTNEFASTSGKTFFNAMLDDEELTGGAWFTGKAEDPEYKGSWFRMFGAKNLNIMNADLINASFETGDLTGWSRDGDGRVISKLGISIPVHGKFMSIISTGLGFTVQTGEIVQDFCIPGDKSTMQFYWKYYSEEFKEWCGSQFQDTFEATISNDVGQLTLVSAKVDDLCHYNDGSCASCPDPGVGNCECGGQYVGLIPSDVSFDQGGVYNIQWQLAEKDITPLAGEGPVKLKFFSTDAGDSIYDTVILIDSIVFK